MANPHRNSGIDLEHKELTGDLTDQEIRDREIEDEMGESLQSLSKNSPLKQKLFEFVYHPTTEIFVFAMIIMSVSLLMIEVSIPTKTDTPVGWLWNTPASTVTVWLEWAEYVLTTFFIIEYVTKLWLAPRKFYFIRTNWIDLLALLPILRSIRIFRPLRILRLIRLIRLVRIGEMIYQRLVSIRGGIRERKAENFIILVYIAFSMIFGTIGIVLFEKGHKSGLDTLGDGLWWCVVTLTTVGYGDKYPVTMGGKIVAGVIMFIGLSFYALLTSVLSTILIERSRQEEGRGMDILGMEGHVVICGWNAHALRLIKDLQQTDHKTKMIILTDREDVPRIVASHIHYIHADPSTAEGLEKARVKFARVAVILSDTKEGRSAQDTDARAILTVLAVENLNSSIHTIVELLNEENVFHVRNAGVDEIIVSGAYTGTMLSQAVQFPGLSAVYGDMFEAGAGVCLKEEDVTKKMVGSKFSEAFSTFFDAGSGVLVGYRRDNQVTVSPRKDFKFQKGDRVILMQRMDS